MSSCFLFFPFLTTESKSKTYFCQKTVRMCKMNSWNQTFIVTEVIYGVYRFV